MNGFLLVIVKTNKLFQMRDYNFVCLQFYFEYFFVSFRKFTTNEVNLNFYIMCFRTSVISSEKNNAF